MPTEWIDVIDTAVKIGLGALISGVAAYQTNKYIHFNSQEEEKRKLIKEILLSSVESADKYFFYLSEYYAGFDGLKRLKIKHGKEADFYTIAKKHLTEYEQGLTEARNHMHTALSSQQLIGNVGASTALKKIRSLESGLRAWYLDLPESKVLPADSILHQWKKDFDESKNKFRESISSEFQEKCL